ncbi:helix-turn-helix domain-containing protein [Chitinophaga sp.]|uniref:winged helix-turn-helix transcriptional regulator n=1 Tax=Chitinophaga sp. TaxID=1869181 RepID=UPI002B87C0C6|nr:helix-turn-helix domain-containing protein [Chitinophaga sp.]HWV66793.1 helix-turn-helix domain-containing protein [Chitinophaga sp.]
MYERKIPEDLECGINVSMKVLSGKWKACILDSISKGIRRPSELHTAINTAAPRVINMQLRELEEYGMVYKKSYPGTPLKVEYYLTHTGESILPVVAAIDQWGVHHRGHIIRMQHALQQPFS